MDREKSHILIVDDNVDQIKLIEIFLKDSKYKTVSVSDGLKAIDAVRDNEFDLILLDVFMPGMNGFEVCEKIKDIPGKCEIPIVFLTAENNPDEIVRGLRIGAIDYIVKPFRSNELRARIDIHVELKKTKDMLTARNESLIYGNRELERVNNELRIALKEIKILKGLIPVCASCKKIRKEDSDPGEQKSWIIMEQYISERSDAEFTHSICPDCTKSLYPEFKL